MQYLFYSFSDDIARPAWESDTAGMEHWRSHLITLCREAAWLGRAPVFPRAIPLDKAHNFNVECSFPARRYLDTENIPVSHRPRGGGPAEALSLSAVSDAELRALDIPQNEILQLPAAAPVSAEQNRRFRLIARRMEPEPVWRLQRAPLLREACALQPAAAAERLAPEDEKRVLPVNLRPSAEVRELAAEIIRQLPRGYCAVHVRRKDYLKIPAFRAWTSPEAVALKLRQAGVAPGVPLYLMSDELSRRWLSRMRKKRPFMHFADFPRLAELIRPPEPDNYFLFLVEREIMEHAAKKILSRAKGADLPRDNVAHLFPMHVPGPEFINLYHPAEIRLSKARAYLFHSPRLSSGFIFEMSYLARFSAFALRALALHWAARLFAPLALKRHRNRRRALGIPG